ncbi:MAG: photosynthetic complex putative assembly protein PuhB [Hyphococcus sp.]
MRLFHDEEDGNPEPIAGLPETLPDGERVIWQGKPKALTLAVHAFHIRLVAIYFLIFTGWRAAEIASRNGAASEILSVATSSTVGAAIGIGILTGIAWLMARSTIYTITDKRIVMRYGVAIRKYINLPFAQITAAALKRHGREAGSIALDMSDKSRVAYLHLWPHARPFRYNPPQPMLRALPDADATAAILCNAMKASSPATVAVTPAAAAPQPAAPQPAAKKSKEAIAAA